MDYAIIFFVALMGAAILGFTAAWVIQYLKLKEFKDETGELTAELKDQEFAFNRLKAENESQVVKINSLQKLLEDVEQQAFKCQENSLEMESELLQWKKAHQQLVDHPKERVREIEVIREVPVLIFRERPSQEDKREKAKKLVKAFKKGYLHENENITPAEK